MVFPARTDVGRAFGAVDGHRFPEVAFKAAVAAHRVHLGRTATERARQQFRLAHFVFPSPSMGFATRRFAATAPSRSSAWLSGVMARPPPLLHPAGRRRLPFQ